MWQSQCSIDFVAFCRLRKKTWRKMFLVQEKITSYDITWNEPLVQVSCMFILTWHCCLDVKWHGRNLIVIKLHRVSLCSIHSQFWYFICNDQVEVISPYFQPFSYWSLWSGCVNHFTAAPTFATTVGIICEKLKVFLTICVLVLG
jgi:hypothetical protein